MRPLRILYVLSRFPNVSTTFIANELTAIREQGDEISIAAIWKPLPNTVPHQTERPFLPNTQYLRVQDVVLWRDALLELIRRPSVLWLFIQLATGHLGSMSLFLKLLAAIPKGLSLGRWARQHQIDHIHAHFLTSPTTVAMIAAHVSGIPYSATIHAIDIFSTNPRTMNGSVALKCKLAKPCVFISEFNQKYVLNKWPATRGAQMEVLYNGIDLKLFTRTAEAAPPLSRTDRPVQLLTNGSFVEKKGHDILLRAVAELRRQQVNVELSIIGRGKLEEQLKALVAELQIAPYVKFVGTVPQEQLAQHYQAADIFALACVVAADGDMDGLPTVLIEALAMEMPTVSTQVSGVPEIVIDQETGLCVETRNVEALASAIRYLIENPEQARDMGKRGRALVERSFQQSTNAARLEQLWQRE